MIVRFCRNFVLRLFSDLLLIHRFGPRYLGVLVIILCDLNGSNLNVLLLRRFKA